MFLNVGCLQVCPRERIAGSYGSPSFSFEGAAGAGSHGRCTSSHSHQQCSRAPSLQHLLLADFLMTAVLTRVRCVVLFCISLVISDVLTICMYSLEKSLMSI